jgi:hypothetical protein
MKEGKIMKMKRNESRMKGNEIVEVKRAWHYNIIDNNEMVVFLEVGNGLFIY